MWRAQLSSLEGMLWWVGTDCFNACGRIAETWKCWCAGTAGGLQSSIPLRAGLGQVSHGSGKLPRMERNYTASLDKPFPPLTTLMVADIPWLQSLTTISCPFLVPRWLCPHYNPPLSHVVLLLGLPSASPSPGGIPASSLSEQFAAKGSF